MGLARPDREERNTIRARTVDIAARPATNQQRGGVPGGELRA